ncbi:DUF4476 domain-containing protein [Niastella caeni]|uniref:DUF4476 domain-containing protein n=1 Tax=Niastella caeni TaxID=2569763 RepID=A0A4S8HYN6_9BACT|nr:DUF4476 domain-containing protein [Niastella caeni]THU40903.1 DUF4476 domain-containing protein [Niastella caeni]
MKKTCIQFLLLIVLALTAHAGHNDGILTITNLSRQDVLIEVDGRPYPECNNALILRDLPAGNHLVKVYIDKGRAFGNRRITIYNKNVYVKPRFYVDIIINRFGRALMDEQQITDNGYDNGGWNDNDNNGNNNNGNNNTPNPWPPRNTNVIPKPIADETFNAFKETIARESFDDSRMAIARPIVDQNYFTSAQAKQLVSMFSFESSKLEIAKYMYGKTIDPKNYFVVYNAFSFSKSKEELAEFIRNYK